MPKPLSTLVNTAILGVLTAHTAHAGGFSLYSENSASAIGNFGAGIAAEAADASTGWYNPAGLALLHQKQAIASAVGVFPKATISGTSTFRAPPQPNYVQNFNDLNGAENGFIPALHYAHPLGNSATFGLSVVAPFGLATDWGRNSPVRYQASFTEVITTTVSPELGGRISEHFALGAGLDLQYAQVKFNRILGVPNLSPLINPNTFDSLSYNKGHSLGVGFHAGLMGIFNDQHTRIGLNYQSKVEHVFRGYSRLEGPLANNGFIFGTLPVNTVSRSNSLFSNSIDLPDLTTLSAYHDINNALALLGSVVYVNWNTLNQIQLNNVAAPFISPLGTVSQVRVSSVSPLNYHSVWRASAGANYKFNSQWMLRLGAGYDPTPTNDVDRDVRLPDVNRWALAIGAHYQMRSNVGMDVGYTHLFTINSTSINRTDALSATSNYNVTGRANGRVDIVGAQLVWTIDEPIPMPTK